MKKFEEAELEVMLFENDNVIVTSGCPPVCSSFCYTDCSGGYCVPDCPYGDTKPCVGVQTT